MNDMTAEVRALDRCTLRTITVADYKDWKAAKEKLDKLEAFGVDNWCGYDEAMKGEF